MERNKNIENELKNIAPGLLKVPFVSTQQVPLGYFDGLEQQIMANVQKDNLSNISDSKEEIQQLSPLLSEIINKNTYQVDADYFEQNAIRLASISNQNTVKVIQFPSQKRIVQLAVAASFIGLIGLLTYILWPNDPSKVLVQKGLEIQTEDAFNRYLDNVNEEEILAYLDQHYLPSDNNEIGGFIDVNDLPEEATYLEEVILSNN